MVKLKPDRYSLDQGLTQSMLATFSNCRQACKFNLDGWEIPGSKKYMDFGHLFHLILENHYGHKNVVDAIALWARQQNKKGIDRETTEKQIGISKMLYDAYCKHWKKKDSTIKWVELENVFDVNFENFRMRGKRDGVYRDKNGKFWLFETKTKGRIDSEIMITLDYDFQNLFYLVAAEKLYNKPFAGVLYNVVRRPDIRESDKSLKQAMLKIQKDIDDRPEHYFKRYEVFYSDKRKRLFRQELFSKIHEFRQWWKGDAPHYKNEMACTGKGACQFISACADPNEKMAGYTQTKKLFEELYD
jgi:hypothetical protein